MLFFMLKEQKLSIAIIRCLKGVVILRRQGHIQYKKDMDCGYVKIIYQFKERMNG